MRHHTLNLLNIFYCFLEQMFLFLLKNIISDLFSRTIFHRLEIGVMWSGLICFSLLQFIEVLRHILGPLPPSICWFQFFWRNCPMIAAMIFFDINLTFRYLACFVYKSVLPLNEDFAARVIYWIVSIWAFIYGLVFMKIPGKMPINYYMCTGKDPKTDFYTQKKVIFEFQSKIC